MRGESVTYRLGTSGEREVLGTLARIDAATDAGARRAQSAWETADRVAEAAIARRERAVERLKALGGTATQNRINDMVGITGPDTKSAEASMRLFIQAQDELATSRARLLAQYDPLFAAQERFNGAMSEAMTLERQGALAAGDLARIHGTARAELDAARVAQDRQVRSSAAMSMGYQQLGFQVSDFAVQVGGGTSAIRAFALQGPQAIQALAMMGQGAESGTGKFAAFATFIRGPWGAALTVAVSVLGALATSLLDSGDAATEAKAKTFDFSKQLNVLELDAKSAADAMKQLADETRTAIIVQGDFSAQRKATADQSVIDLNKRLGDLQKELREAQARKPGTILDAVGVYNNIQRISELKDAIAQTRTALADAETAATNAAIGTSQTRISEMLDQRTKIEGDFKRDVGELENRLRASREDEIGATSAGIYLSQKQYEAELKRLMTLKQQRLDAVKTEEEARRCLERGSTTSQHASVGDMTALLRQLLPGVQITSTTGGKHVTGSDHYSGRAIDFVPAGGMGRYTKEAMRSLLQEAGVDIRRNAKGVEQFFGPGDRGHSDHFHLAWKGTASPEEATRIAARLEKDLADERERNAKSVRALLEAGDPALAIANQLKDDLAEIDRLAKVGPAGGGMGSEEADIASGNARKRAFEASFDLAMAPNAQAREEWEQAEKAKREFVTSTLADQGRQNRLLDVELGTVRASGFERDRQRASLELIEQLKERSIALDSEEAQQIIRGNDALIAKGEQLAQVNALWEEQRRTGEAIIDTLFDPSNWDNWGEMGKRVIRMLIQELLTLAAINPLKNMLYGSDLPTLGGGGIKGFLGGLFSSAAGALGSKSGGAPGSGINKTGRAIGSEYDDGGWHRVGEFGEELIRTPRGSQIMNAGRTRQMDRAQGSALPASITINAPGADAAALRRVEEAVQQLNATLENRAVSAVADANQRSFGALFSV